MMDESPGILEDSLADEYELQKESNTRRRLA